MILARPETVTPLEHGGYHLAVAACGLVISVARDRRCSVFRPGEPPRTLRLPQSWQIESLSISPTGERLSVERLAEMAECTVPAFSPSGDRLVMLCDDAELRHYAFADGRLLGRMPWPFQEEESEPGDHALFAGDRRALFSTNEHRLHLVDLQRMQRIDEVAVAGHEPRPAWEIYRFDPADEDLCTDMAEVASLGADAFVTRHLDLPTDKPIQECTEHIVSWRLE